MHIEQEWVCGNLNYSAQNTQYKHDTLKDSWKWDMPHSRKILKHSPRSSVIRGAWAGWNCLSLNTVLFCTLKYIYIFFWISRTMKVAPIAVTSTSVRRYHFSFRNIPGDLKFILSLLVISFGLPRLNIARHLNYTIKLFKI